MEPYENSTRVSRFDMMLVVMQEGNRLDLGVEYSTQLFKLETIEIMLTDYRDILQQVLESPKIVISDIKIVRESEPQAIEAQAPEISFGF